MEAYSWYLIIRFHNWYQTGRVYGHFIKKYDEMNFVNIKKVDLNAISIMTISFKRMVTDANVCKKNLKELFLQKRSIFIQQV